jgi:HK97 gp10 family phage protein
MLVWNDRELLVDIEKVSDKLLEKGADQIEKDAKHLCPVKTGALRDSIEKNESKFADGGYIISAYGDKVGRNGSPKFYASFVETGVSPNGDQAPQPFLRPALHKNKRKLQQLFNNPKLINTKVLK